MSPSMGNRHYSTLPAMISIPCEHGNLDISVKIRTERQEEEKKKKVNNTIVCTFIFAIALSFTRKEKKRRAFNSLIYIENNFQVRGRFYFGEVANNDYGRQIYRHLNAEMYYNILLGWNFVENASDKEKSWEQFKHST